MFAPMEPEKTAAWLLTLKVGDTVAIKAPHESFYRGGPWWVYRITRLTATQFILENQPLTPRRALRNSGAVIGNTWLKIRPADACILASVASHGERTRLKRMMEDFRITDAPQAHVTALLAAFIKLRDEKQEVHDG